LIRLTYHLFVLGHLSDKVRDQIITFSESFRHVFQEITKLEKEAHESMGESSHDENIVSQLYKTHICCFILANVA